MLNALTFNLLIAAVICTATYGLTLYFDRQPPPRQVTIAPDLKFTVTDLEASKPVPAFAFTDMDGKSHEITDFKGKIVILNFWATWCAPCIVEFPALLDAAQAHKKDVVLIALSSDIEKEKVTQFLQKISQTHKAGKNAFIAIDDMGKITQDVFSTYRLPETIIIDREQNMRSKLVGANWTPEDLSQIIGSLQ